MMVPTIMDRLLMLLMMLTVPLGIFCFWLYRKKMRKSEVESITDSPYQEACLKDIEANPNRWQRIRAAEEKKRKEEKEFRANVAVIADSIRKNDGKV